MVFDLVKLPSPTLYNPSGRGDYKDNPELSQMQKSEYTMQIICYSALNKCGPPVQVALQVNSEFERLVEKDTEMYKSM